MPDMSSDQIRDIAVRCVEGFLNDKTPLSQGLAKEASSYDMNPEQIKRACEATNTITQLKLLQMSQDRTIEFPLCKYAEVMQDMCVPASVSSGSGIPDAFQKSASVQEPVEAFTPTEVSYHEQKIHFIKEAAINKRRLEDLEVESNDIVAKLVKTAAQIKADPAWLDKLSCVQTSDYAQLSALISGSVQPKRNFEGLPLFKEAQLKEINQLTALYCTAKELVKEAAARRDLADRCSLTKQAMLGTMANATGKAVGATVAATGKPVAKFLVSPSTGIRKANTFVKKISNNKTSLASIGIAAGMDSAMYRSSGGPGVNSMGASRDVWDALQS